VTKAKEAHIVVGREPPKEAKVSVVVGREAPKESLM